MHERLAAQAQLRSAAADALHQSATGSCYLGTRLPVAAENRPDMRAQRESTMRAEAGTQQRVVILMVDGLGLDYYAHSSMPTLKAWASGGVFAEVKAVMPSVTNANNVSISCGSFPELHGAVGNSWLDESTGQESTSRVVTCCSPRRSSSGRHARVCARPC